MSSGMRLPFGETEADDFVDRVDEVSRLIEGLKDGSLPAEYVDQRESEIVEREEKREEKRKKEEEEEESRRFDKLPKERQEELLRKVEDLQRNKDRKDRLRAAYEAHQKARRERAEAAAAEGAAAGQLFGTDYHAWDLVRSRAPHRPTSHPPPQPPSPHHRRRGSVPVSVSVRLT